MKKITSSINPELNTVFTVYKGKIGIEDLIEQTKTIQANPKFKRNMNSLVDLTLAKPDIDIDFEKVNQYKEFIASVQKLRGTCKWAIVAPDDLVFGLSRMFEVLSSGLTIQTKVFRNEREARQWLGIPEVVT